MNGLYKFTNIVLLLCTVCQITCIRKYTSDDLVKLREEVREMFQHAYDSYLRYAYPYDELRPLSCDGVDTWGSYSLTLIDALDTLAIMGNHSEFNRVVDIVSKRKNFDSDINVSVFETNIRIIGGLLSAHLLSHRTGLELEPGWPCNGPLLRLAEDAAQRLIAAFDTTTGMPYGTINLRFGVPKGETSVTCTAGVGTFIIEFGTLSRLTGDPLYEEVALHALKALYNHRSPIGLLGNHIDVMTGRWTAQDAGIGGGVDSYFEYLVKGAILLERPELMAMFNEARVVIDKYLKKDDWYVWVTMLKGQVTLPVFQSLEAYWPGVLSLIGESDTAMRIIHNYHSVWRQYGFTPEVYNLGAGEASSNRESYPLRPELIESIMYLYRDTRDPVLLQMGEDILRSIQHSARTTCGYATIKDVRDHKKEDRMESFFLSETTKYLYLLFDPDNFIHNPGSEATIIDTPSGECVVDLGGYIFNTEAHPIDPALLHCCHEANKGINYTNIKKMHEVLDSEERIKIQIKLEEIQKKTAAIAENEAQTPAPVHEMEINEPESFQVEGKASIEEISIADVDNDNLVNKDVDSSELIKTETRAGYVNIDGNEIDETKNLSNLPTIQETNEIEENKNQLKNFTNYLESVKNSINQLSNDKESMQDEKSSGTPKNDVNIVNSVANIKLPSQKSNIETSFSPPSRNQAKEAIKMLPAFVQDFLNNPSPKERCEPQVMLERIRRENLYADHWSVQDYSLFLTSAPQFLQRISLAGEFVNKKES